MSCLSFVSRVLLRQRGLPCLVAAAALPCSSTSSLPFLQPSRSFAKRRRTIIEKVKIKEVKSSKRIVEYYKDMTAEEFSSILGEPFDDVLEVLVDMDERNLKVVESGKVLDPETATKAITAFGCKPKLVSRAKVVEDVKEDLEPQPEAVRSACVPRAPVVTIMGHVDHGKTTLLDALRNSRIVDGEFGGITQHIGAFSVYLSSANRRVTFLDTPGHAAFAAMRERGARVTDVVVLVVAADDGTKEQTVQSIKFAKDAGVPIVVAVNKCDKPGADPGRAKRSLLEHDVVIEELGGDVQCVEVSALYSRNLLALQEALLTQADLLDLHAPVTGLVEGHIIESSVAHGLGKVCTVLISRGTLSKGHVLVAGTAWTRVRTMTDDAGIEISEAGPATPVRISGWKDTIPAPGDVVLEAPDSAAAQRAIAYRIRKDMEEKAAKDWDAIGGAREAARAEYLANRQVLLDKGRRFGSTLRQVVHKERRFQKDSGEDGQPRLAIILRCDVEGTMEAILDVLESYESERCRLQLVDFGVGPPNERDLELAETSKASIYTFNLTTSMAIKSMADKKGIEMKSFNVVYRLVEELKNDLSSALPVLSQLKLVGQGHVLKEFVISDRNRKRLPIAGVLVDWGDFQKNCIFRFSRESEVYFEGTVESMKCGTEVVANAKTNTEVGIALDNKNIRFKEGDSVEVFEKENLPQIIDWYPPGF